ncbi:hypothetical protein BH11BAC3_BH11BAC3_27870 [soil metagenome]
MQAFFGLLQEINDADIFGDNNSKDDDGIIKMKLFKKIVYASEILID